MQSKTKSIFEEIRSIDRSRDREFIIENRAEQAIASVKNVIDMIDEIYEENIASDLKRKLFNSVKLGDPLKFQRSIRKLKTTKMKRNDIVPKKNSFGRSPVRALLESGSIEGTGVIHKSEINPTLEYLEKYLGVDLQNNITGSSGKNEFSGDIDVVVRMSRDMIPAFVSKLSRIPGIGEIKKSNIIMSKIKIQNYQDNIEVDAKRTGYVQVDFIPSEEPNWTKTYYHSPSEDESKYKGVYRNLLLAIFLKYKDAKNVGNGVIERYMLSPRDGVVRIRRTLSTNKNEIIAGPWKDAASISKISGIPSIDSFESIFQYIIGNFSSEFVKKIIDEFSKNDTIRKFGLPDEMGKYLT